ncbi:MAG: hypothetical protein U5L05_15210 [Rubrivivax sp.]|nr:hypothetical protein [Rubrivivax sp.]
MVDALKTPAAARAAATSSARHRPRRYMHEWACAAWTFVSLVVSPDEGEHSWAGCGEFEAVDRVGTPPTTVVVDHMGPDAKPVDQSMLMRETAKEQGK